MGWLNRVRKALFPTQKRTIARIPVALLLIWTAIWWLGSSSSTLGVFATATGPIVCVIAFVWLLAALTLRDWIGAGVTAAIVAVTVVGFQVVPMQEQLKPLPQSQKQHVLTTVQIVEVNALLGTASPTALARLVRNRQADFLVLAESNDTFLTPRLIKAGVEKLLPYRYSVDTHMTTPGSEKLGNAIWSKWPIDAKRRVPGTFNPTLSIDVTVHGFPLTLVATRAQNPLVSRSQWAGDMRAIADYVPKVSKDRRLIVAGDFNASFGHSPFNSVLATGLQDAQAKVNWPWQRFTFPTYTRPEEPPMQPFMQIDHVLFGAGFWVNSARTVMIPDTDHSATAVDLWITRR
jgi:endonuclease/exonuclease/phosphatase family metal-dependent hydrolase